MVTDAIVGWVADFIIWVWSLLPEAFIPSWYSGVDSGIQVAFQYASSMGAWLPVALGFAVAASVLLCIIAGATIKVIRSLLSYFTAGGGSAG